MTRTPVRQGPHLLPRRALAASSRSDREWKAAREWAHVSFSYLLGHNLFLNPNDTERGEASERGELKLMKSLSSYKSVAKSFQEHSSSRSKTCSPVILSWPHLSTLSRTPPLLEDLHPTMMSRDWHKRIWAGPPRILREIKKNLKAVVEVPICELQMVRSGNAWLETQWKLINCTELYKKRRRSRKDGSARSSQKRRVKPQLRSRRRCRNWPTGGVRWLWQVEPYQEAD